MEVAPSLVSLPQMSSQWEDSQIRLKECWLRLNSRQVSWMVMPLVSWALLSRHSHQHRLFRFGKVLWPLTNWPIPSSDFGWQESSITSLLRMTPSVVNSLWVEQTQRYSLVISNFWTCLQPLNHHSGYLQCLVRGSLRFQFLSQYWYSWTTEGVTVNGNSVAIPTGNSAISAIDTGTTLIGGPSSGVKAVYAAIPGSQALSGQMQGFYAYRASSIPVSPKFRLIFFCSRLCSLCQQYQRFDLIRRQVMAYWPCRHESWIRWFRTLSRWYFWLEPWIFCLCWWRKPKLGRRRHFPRESRNTYLFFCPSTSRWSLALLLLPPQFRFWKVSLACWHLTHHPKSRKTCTRCTVPTHPLLDSHNSLPQQEVQVSITFSCFCKMIVNFSSEFLFIPLYLIQCKLLKIGTPSVGSNAASATFSQTGAPIPSSSAGCESSLLSFPHHYPFSLVPVPFKGERKCWLIRILILAFS